MTAWRSSWADAVPDEAAKQEPERTYQHTYSYNNIQLSLYIFHIFCIFVVFSLCILYILTVFAHLTVIFIFTINNSTNSIQQTTTKTKPKTNSIKSSAGSYIQWFGPGPGPLASWLEPHDSHGAHALLLAHLLALLAHRARACKWPHGGLDGWTG